MNDIDFLQALVDYHNFTLPCGARALSSGAAFMRNHFCVGGTCLCVCACALSSYGWAHCTSDGCWLPYPRAYARFGARLCLCSFVCVHLLERGFSLVNVARIVSARSFVLARPCLVGRRFAWPYIYLARVASAQLCLIWFVWNCLA